MGNDPNDSPQGSGSSSYDELSEYRHVFIEESAEELDSLVEAILSLESDPRKSDALNKAFRMLHSLKGSCGMMGFEVLGNFAHVLEDRFENYRAGKDTLDRDTTTLVLKCVDFFRSFIERLRAGNTIEGDPSELLRQLNETGGRKSAGQPQADQQQITGTRPANYQLPPMSLTGGILVRVKFKPNLQLADLKARLIVSRLASIGEVVACDPRIEDVHSFDELPLFSLTLLTDRKLDEVRKIANVDGVESVEFEGEPLPTGSMRHNESAFEILTLTAPPDENSQAGQNTTMLVSVTETTEPQSKSTAKTFQELPAASSPTEPATEAQGSVKLTLSATTEETKGQASETLRVDVDRLDRLMNLTGELVVTNARFAQITAQMSPVFRRNSVFNKSKDLTEKLRHRFKLARHQIGDSAFDDRWNAVFDGLEEELDGLDQQSKLWDDGHSQFLQITEAVDQLSLVSKNLQRGVLNTRMVPVGPLLNRFKRVIRDLSVERGKQVQLEIHGEKTELDRRMIDSLGDPLLHLVRNSIDHGIESPEQRNQVGKPDAGTISIAAVHRGNNVLITVQDDGGGINTERIRAKIISRGLAAEPQVSEMTEKQVMDYIWHPGFSTAEQVSDISGRGVGMDIVRSAISDLSGSIDVASTPGKGTIFTIRLPLTLAIIRSLLVRFREGVFSIPIDDVREIVSVPQENVYAVHRHLTIDVRGELIPLVTMEDVFDWNHLPERDSHEPIGGHRNINVVLLHTRGKTLGLRVDALVGRADIVIKSLTDNFVAIRGISGASVMGDGAVCLMLECTAMVELAGERAAAAGSLRRQGS